MSLRLSFVHLVGPRAGEVDEVTLPAVLGSGPDAAVRAPGAAARHALVFERGGEILVQDASSGEGTLLDGEAVQEAVLREGDVLRLGHGGPALRLEARGESEALLEATAWDRAGGPLGAFGRVISETLAQISPPVRRLVALLVVLALVAAGWSHVRARLLRAEVARLQLAVRQSEEERQRFGARVEEERRLDEAARTTLTRQLEELRQREESLRQKLAETAAGEVQAVRGELALTRERLATVERERAVGERIIRELGPGVCLIQGSWRLEDAQGRPLRVHLDENGQPLADADGRPRVDGEGNGPFQVVEFVGTGFLVDRRGLVLTNRHVAQPWWNDSEAQALVERGFVPRLTTLRAFFPRLGTPVPLSVERHAASIDLSLLRCDLDGRRIPPLPLDRTGRRAVPGRPVVVIGYPAGIEAIVAKADAVVVREILASTGTSVERITEALAARGLVRPSTTQGHIGDVTETDIVFDAPTAQGGSGGPLLDKDGVVIGVEYAVLSRFGGNAFAVPVRHAVALLARGKEASR
jgi:S1-C subfamily serine protease